MKKGRLRIYGALQYLRSLIPDISHMKQGRVVFTALTYVDINRQLQQ